MNKPKNLYLAKNLLGKHHLCYKLTYCTTKGNFCLTEPSMHSAEYFLQGEKMSIEKTRYNQRPSRFLLRDTKILWFCSVQILSFFFLIFFIDNSIQYSIQYTCYITWVLSPQRWQHLILQLCNLVNLQDPGLISLQPDDPLNLQPRELHEQVSHNIESDWALLNWKILKYVLRNNLVEKYLLFKKVLLEYFFFIYLFIASVVGYPLYTEFFYIITQWSCSASGSLWEMPDSNPGPLPQKSGALPMSHHISSMSHHISCFLHWKEKVNIFLTEQPNFLRFFCLYHRVSKLEGPSPVHCTVYSPSARYNVYTTDPHHPS